MKHTRAQTKRIQPDPDEVWPFEGDVGNRRAMQVVGTVAAPLLAGFAFTLLVLVLQTFGPTSTTVRAGKAVVTTTPGAFSADPVVAAALLVLAGVLLIFATQAGFTMVLHDQKPSDLQEWAPQRFRDSGPQHPTPRFPSEINRGSPDGFWSIRAGSRWCSGEARTYLYDEIRRANRSARWLRALYNLGIVSLLWGVTFLVWPPGTEATAWRIVATAFAGAGAAIETLWSGWILVGMLATLLYVRRTRTTTPDEDDSGLSTATPELAASTDFPPGE